MKSSEITGGFVVEGRIEKRVHNVRDLHDSCNNWEQLTENEKLAASRTVEPAEEETTHNVTTDRFHKYIVDNLNPKQTSAKDNVSALWMGLGNDAESGTSTTDTDLNNRLFSKAVTDHIDDGKSLITSTFIDSTELNNSTLDEVGLFSNDPANLTNSDVFLINHSTFSDVIKDDRTTVTFDVVLTFSNT